MDATAQQVLKELTPKDQIIVYPIEFYSDHVQKPDGTFVLEDYVEWAKKGEAQPMGNSRVAVVKKHNPDVWRGLEPYYDAWKNKQDAPLNGTPLSQWVCPGLGKHLIKHLLSINIITVEDIANSNDQICQKIGMGAIKIREYAREFVKTKGGQAVIAAEMVARDEQIAYLMKKVEHLTASLEAKKSRKKA